MKNILKLLAVLLYIYLLFYQTKKNDTFQMILLTLFTALFLCKIDNFNSDTKNRVQIPLYQGADEKKPQIFKPEIIEGYGCGNKSGQSLIEGMANNGPEYQKETNRLIKETKEKIDKAQNEKPKEYKMSHYDGVCLKTGNEESWFGGPDNVPFVPNDELYTYFSPQAPLKAVKTDNSQTQGNPIDGVKGSPEKMFILANNRSSLNCCPSTFSTSTGCICTTKKQRDFISSRGINHLSKE
tara:strand:- start:11219 stop:11935 length:717 start_codon:yes stop_codon:yes gene_type:complete